MVTLKQFLRLEIETLSEQELEQVSDFIAFVKFRSQTARWQISKSQLAELYNEFTESDNQAEEEWEAYAELLRLEDVK